MALMVGSLPAVVAGSEEGLIVAARDGDDRAFEELYARYRDRISAYIHRRVADHGRAEDVAQEVFISALRRMRNSDQALVFKPWIYEIAKNACIDEHRRQIRCREVPLDHDADGPVDRRPLRSVAPTPPAVLESKLQLQDLRGAFGGLSENHHRLLVMREFEGLTYEEIGEQLGMSRQMVESALFRARRKLGLEYEELSSGRRCQQVQTAIEEGRVQAVHSLGIRERRQLARHLAHCQTCRAQAQLAGVAEPLLHRRGLAARIAALLPFPLWGWRRSVSASRAAARGTGGHAASQVGLAAGPTLPAALTGVAAAVATMVIAGGGASGALAGHPRPRGHSAAAHVTSASAITASGTQRRPLRKGRSHSAQPSGAPQPRAIRLSHQPKAVTHSRTASPAGPKGPSVGSSSSQPSRVSAATPSASRVVNAVSGTLSHVVSGAGQTVSRAAAPVENTVHQVAQTVSHTLSSVHPPSVTAPSASAASGTTTGDAPDGLLPKLG